MLDLPERIEFELGWLAFGFLVGLSFLTYVQPVSVSALLPAWFVPVWAVCWLIGALLGVPGALASLALGRSRRYWGYVGERAGLSLHAVAALAWAASSIYLWAYWPNTEMPHPPFPIIIVGLSATWVVVTLRRIVRTTITIKAMTAPEPEGDLTEE